jgi:hypothetical protein
VPIDIDHERREAGGWIKQLTREGEKLLAVVDWNALGKQLIGDKVYKYVSATIDTAKKVIKSVSLVNFPAVKGLKPVELSEHALSYQQVGWFDAVQEMIASLMSKDKTAVLADGMPGSVTITQYLTAHIHKMFTNCADNLALSGYLSTDERKQLSAAIGSALDALSGGIGEAGNRLIPTMNFYPEYGMAEHREQRQEETKPMSETQLTEAELREKIKAELEAEMAQQQQTEAQLRERVKKEVEAELSVKFQRRQGLVKFAEELCNGEHALSAKADDVVAFLEALPDDQLEAAKNMLKAKVVNFGEVGHGGDAPAKKEQLPAHVRADVISGELTLKAIFDAKAINGKPEDYDLSEFSAAQKGF